MHDSIIKPINQQRLHEFPPSFTHLSNTPKNLCRLMIFCKIFLILGAFAKIYFWRWNAMKMLRSFFLLFLIISFSLAQNKLLTMEDAILGSYENLKIKNLPQLQWMGQSKAFCYVDSLDGEYGLIQVDARQPQPQMFLTLDSLNTLMKKAHGPILKRFPYLRWLDAHTFRFMHKNVLYRADLKHGQIMEVNRIPEDAANIQVHPKRDYVAYTIKNNLFVSLKPGEEIQVTFNPEGVKAAMLTCTDRSLASTREFFGRLREIG